MPESANAKEKMVLIRESDFNALIECRRIYAEKIGARTETIVAVPGVSDEEAARIGATASMLNDPDNDDGVINPGDWVNGHSAFRRVIGRVVEFAPEVKR